VPRAVVTQVSLSLIHLAKVVFIYPEKAQDAGLIACSTLFAKTPLPTRPCPPLLMRHATPSCSKRSSLITRTRMILPHMAPVLPLLPQALTIKGNIIFLVFTSLASGELCARVFVFPLSPVLKPSCPQFSRNVSPKLFSVWMCSARQSLVTERLPPSSLPLSNN